LLRTKLIQNYFHERLVSTEHLSRPRYFCIAHACDPASLSELFRTIDLAGTTRVLRRELLG